MYKNFYFCLFCFCLVIILIKKFSILVAHVLTFLAFFTSLCNYAGVRLERWLKKKVSLTVCCHWDSSISIELSVEGLCNKKQCCAACAHSILQVQSSMMHELLRLVLSKAAMLLAKQNILHGSKAVKHRDFLVYDF